MVWYTSFQSLILSVLPSKSRINGVIISRTDQYLGFLRIMPLQRAMISWSMMGVLESRFP